jgi:hypothetical protein
VKRISQALAAGILLSMSTFAPALADDDKTMGMVKGTAMFPVKVAAVSTALVVGTPIAIVRRTAVRIRDFTSQAADNIGGKDSFPPNFFASFFSVPAGTLVGVSEGCYYGAKNAIVNGVEKPFSLDAFSLADME